MHLSLAQKEKKRWGSILRLGQGLGLTLLIAGLAILLSRLPFLAMLGPMILAILLGITWKQLIGIRSGTHAGIAFSAKTILRAGIILLGLRLSIVDLFQSGGTILLLSAVNIGITMLIMVGLGRLFHVDENVALLTASGTAICGAAAVAAIGSQVSAKEGEITYAVVAVAVLGTMFTLLYTMLYPLHILSPAVYGTFAGLTLHELAHVLAAASSAGQTAVDTALIAKLARVALLVAVAFVVQLRLSKRVDKNDHPLASRRLPIPWFILGFLAASLFHSLNLLPPEWTASAISLSLFMITMAMAALGLQVDLQTMLRSGFRPILVALIGSILLAAIGLIETLLL